MRDSLPDIAQYTQLGITLAAAVLLGFFGGYWIDGLIGTRPLLAIVGVFIAGASGMIHLVRTMRRLQQDIEARERGDDGSGSGDASKK